MQGRNPGSTLFGSSYEMCDKRLPADSIFRILERRGHALFRDEDFADLYQEGGRSSIPTRTVATVMVLQRQLGLTDRAAVEAFAYDLRWKYAAGRLPEDTPPFNHVVLVEMRARLARSARPDRIFEIIMEEAEKLGLVGRRRVVDSTALYDAVATQDSVTLLRNAIVSLMGKLSEDEQQRLLAQLSGEDSYAKPGKPKCDWDDEEERAALLKRLTSDAGVLLEALRKRDKTVEEQAALSLLEMVLGQDFKTAEGGQTELIRGVAPDRIISTVDPEARHGHKTESRSFDGYKGHIAIDPESELITSTEVTAGNVGDAEPAEDLLADILNAPADSAAPPFEVYGDASYGTAQLLEKLESHGIVPEVKVQAPSGRKGKFTQDKFDIDVDSCRARCPHGQIVPLRRNRDGSHFATFGAACNNCPLKGRCTDSNTGRLLSIHAKHKLLAQHRKRQAQPGWRGTYNLYRPRVERKFAQLMRHRHGGRRARVRGRARVARDFAMLAAASNLNRLAKLTAKQPDRLT